jgi:hypothetical protein
MIAYLVSVGMFSSTVCVQFFPHGSLCVPIVAAASQRHRA